MEMAELGSICQITMGQSPPGSTYNSEGIGMPFFQGKAEFTDRYPIVRKWTTEPKKTVEKDDVLISVRAPVGPTNFAPSKACIGRGLAGLRPKGGLSPDYLVYALKATVNELAAKATGSTFEAISGDQLRSHLVPVAEPETAQQIVEHLDLQFSRLEAGVAALKRAKENLKRCRASILKAACEGRLVPTEAQLACEEGRNFESGEQLLVRILEERRRTWSGKGKYAEPRAPIVGAAPEPPEGWVSASIGQIADVGTGATPNRGKAQFYEGGVIPWVTSGALNETTVTAAKEFVTEAAVRQTNLTLYPPGTLLVAMYGEGKTRGKCSELQISATTNQAIAAIQVKSELRPFVKVCLMSLYEKIRLSASGGVQPNLNLSLVRQISLLLPPLAEQQRIVAEVERRFSILDQMESVIEASLTRATRLRQSILSTAFKPSDEPSESGSILVNAAAPIT